MDRDVLWNALGTWNLELERRWPVVAENLQRKTQKGRALYIKPEQLQLRALGEVAASLSELPRSLYNVKRAQCSFKRVSVGVASVCMFN
jgi:hypothetical protein